MKTCIFITGTNATGKTSVAKALIDIFGGIKTASKRLTVCNDNRYCFAGKYEAGHSYGGVDGFNQTKILESVVREGLTNSEVIVCEGMYLHTFGLNLTNAMFVAERHLLCFLYAPPAIIDQRLRERSGRGIANKAVIQKQNNCYVAAKKWASIGVPVMMIDTSAQSVQEIATDIAKKISVICGL